MNISLRKIKFILFCLFCKVSLPIFVLTCCFIIIFQSGCTNQPKKYTIGFISNFEGTNSQATIESLEAINLAYNAFHLKHPKSFTVEVLPFDDSLDPVKIKKVYNDVRYKCDIFICISTSDAFLSIYDDVKKNASRLHVALGISTTAISHQDDNVVRNLIDMEVEQKSIAEFLNERGIKKLLIVRENKKNYKYTDKAFEYFANYFKGSITHKIFSAPNTNVNDAKKELRTSQYDYVYVLTGGMPREAGIVAQSLCAIRPKIKVITTPWVRGSILQETVGKYLDNLIIPSHILLSKSNMSYQQFIDEFYKSRKYYPGYMAGPAYDAMNILLDAIHKTKSTKAESLKKVILKDSYETTTGKISFNKYGDVDGKLFFYKIFGDKYEIIE